MPKTKPKNKHEAFLQTVQAIRKEIKGRILPQEAYQVAGAYLQVILNHAKWLDEYVKTKTKTNKINSQTGGRKRLPDSDVSERALFMRSWRAAKKLEPDLTVAQFKARENTASQKTGKI